MPITVQPLSEILGATITGIDLREPLGGEAFETISDALFKHHVVVFPEQNLDDDQLVAFSSRFGKLDRHVQSEWNSESHPEIYIISNIGKGVPYGGFEWHSDFCYMQVPALFTLLYGIEVPPEGGETYFSNMEAVYETLPTRLRERVDGLLVEFNYNDYRLRNPARTPLPPDKIKETTNTHPAVRRHPVTGRPALYVCEFASRFEGMTDEDSKALLRELMEHATRDEFVYAHKWQAGDVVMWDNPALMHRASPYDQKYRRLMHRTVSRPVAGLFEATGRPTAAAHRA